MLTPDCHAKTLTGKTITLEVESSYADFVDILTSKATTLESSHYVNEIQDVYAGS